MTWPHGEFIIGDGGYKVSNQFTIFGMQSVLRSAFQGNKLPWYIGLCAHSPADTLALSSLGEPSIANGYDRQLLPLTIAHWPTLGNVNGESYIESRQFTFPITAPLDVQVNRLFITDNTQVIAISSPIMDGGLQLLTAAFTTRYRLYFR